MVIFLDTVEKLNWKNGHLICLSVPQQTFFWKDFFYMTIIPITEVEILSMFEFLKNKAHQAMMVYQMEF